MDWIRAHLTLVYGLGLGLVIIGGAVLVSNKFSTSQSNVSFTWGSYGGGQFIPNSTEALGSSRQTPPPEQQYTLSQLSQTLEHSPDRLYASLSPGAQTLSGGANISAASSSDAIEQLLKSLNPASFTGNISANQGALDAIYYFIPKSIGSLDNSGPSKKMTSAQSALYNYGNEAGSAIQTYESLWAATQANVHRAYIEDPTDPAKAASLARVGKSLLDVSASLNAMSDVPAAMKTIHQNLVSAYKDLGQKTIAISQAQGDDGLLAAINSYNASAENLLNAYLAVATVFNLNSVTFQSTEPGSVFVYNQSQPPGQ